MCHNYFRNHIMGGILTFLGPGNSQEDEQLKKLNERKIRQDDIIKEIKDIESCIYCYVDHRLEKLLLPWAEKAYPWDLDCQLLSTIREEPKDRTENCSHCPKGPKYSPKIIDKLFDKQTDDCHCGEIHTSTEDMTGIR